MDKVVLVTGGAGYIGSHACKALAHAGYSPVVYDNLIYGHRDFAKWGPLEEGDITDPVRLAEVMLRHRPEAVLHFAAFAYVGESVENPAKYYRNNVLGTFTLLETMRETGINKIVFSSTCATYGIPSKIPIPENHPQFPINPYGQTKLIIERMLQDYDKAYDIKSISLRYFNAAGADPDCEVGEDHDPETHLIPLVLDAACGKRPHITVFGNDYDTPDGTCVRDYIHVTDLANAHVLALQYLEKQMRTNAFNLGNGHGYSVLEVIAAAERVAGREIPFHYDPRREGDPDRLVGDARKAAKELEWRPKYSDIDIIIKHAWEWHVRRSGIRLD